MLFDKGHKSLFTQSPSLEEKWASIVEQKRNIWILAELSTTLRVIDPWGVFDPLSRE